MDQHLDDPFDLCHCSTRKYHLLKERRVRYFPRRDCEFVRLLTMPAHNFSGVGRSPLFPEKDAQAPIVLGLPPRNITVMPKPWKRQLNNVPSSPANEQPLGQLRVETC